MAAVLQNYGNFAVPTPVPQANPALPYDKNQRIPARGAAATPTWGVNFLRDLFVRDDVKASVLEEYFWMNKFVNSGIIARNSDLDGKSGGVTVEYPFFQEMNFEEEDVDSNEYWGASGQGYLTPQRIQTSKFVIPRVSKGFAFGADKISRIASGEDPMAAMRSYVASNLQTFRTRQLLAMLDACYATGGPLVDQQYRAPDPAGAVPLPGEALSITQVVQALNLLGERSSNVKTIAMHSSVYHWLMHQGMLQFSSPQAPTTGSAITWGGGGIGVSDPGFQYFAGLRVLVDDMLVPEPGGTPGKPNKFPVYLFGDGAVQEGVQREFEMLFDTNILSGPQDIAACYYIWAIGIPGISWVGTPAAIPDGSVSAGPPKLPAAAWNPTYAHLSDLKKPTNWVLAWNHRQYVPIVKMTTYSPFGGVYA